MTEEEWLTCDWPWDMPMHLDGKVDDKAFMWFSAACCRRIWPLITDPRSRAVVEATEAYLAGTMTAEAAVGVCEIWDKARDGDEVKDLAGGNTDDAIESVYDVGDGHAGQVQKACFESAGWHAASSACPPDAPHTQAEWTAAWRAAEEAERLAQCRLIREIFGNPFRPLTVGPSSLTPTVASLAQAAFDERQLPSGELDPVRLAVLADALEEAGADDEVLSHLRGPGPHVRGCWVVETARGAAPSGTKLN